VKPAVVTRYQFLSSRAANWAAAEFLKVRLRFKIFRWINHYNRHDNDIILTIWHPGQSNVDCLWDSDMSSLGNRGNLGTEAAQHVPASLLLSQSFSIHLFAQGLPLFVVNHCLKPSPLPRRMGHAFMSEQVRPGAFIAYK
jgi:hypothetical protein